MAVFPQYDSRPYDTAMALADTQTVTTSAALQVSSADQILDLGAAHFQGDAVFDIGAVDVTTGDESSKLLIQGSNSATFASGVVTLAAALFGDSTITGDSADRTGSERVVIPFENVRAGTVYRYLRGYVLAAGTSPSIVVTRGWVSPRQ